MSDLKLLCDLGFALIPLKEKSKSPVESGWTKMPRSSWEEFSAKYKPKMNVGVRLGEASQIRDGFLACIDCDVKTKDPRHKAEMTEALLAFFPDTLNSPTVKSGSGVGAHVYCLTKTPIKQTKIAESREMVLVQGKKNLTPAWDITVYSTGRQMALPPSIHPKTGRPYIWKREVEGLGSLKMLAIEAEDIRLNPPTEDKTTPSFKFVEVSDLTTRLDTETYAKLLDGEGVTDRSAELYLVACAMAKASYSVDEIMSVLTDPMYYLGNTGFDHVGSQDQKRAADWVYKFSVKKAFEENSPIFDFGVVTEWYHELERSKAKWSIGKIKDTVKNAWIILNHLWGAPAFKLNEFTHNVELGVDIEGVGKRNDVMDDNTIHAIRSQLFYHPNFKAEFSISKLFEAAIAGAIQRPYHPVKDWVDSIKWDGQKRVDMWLTTYLGTPNTDYSRQVARKLLCAIMARVYSPGTKFDYVVILEGRQGIGKSTAIRHLVGDKWFADSEIDPRNMKDTVQLIMGKLVIELGEMSTMYKSDLNTLKAFISRQVDKVRPPYERSSREFPRQCIFMGTTNAVEYLKDATGNRRFWPVEVSGYDYKNAPLLKDRDQLFAEAKVIWDEGEILYLEGDAAKQATKAQEGREAEDPADLYVELFEDWRDRVKSGQDTNLSGINLDEIPAKILISDFGPFPNIKADNDKSTRNMRAGMRKLGYEPFKTKRDGSNVRLWCKNKKV